MRGEGKLGIGSVDLLASFNLFLDCSFPILDILSCCLFRFISFIHIAFTYLAQSAYDACWVNFI